MRGPEGRRSSPAAFALALFMGAAGFAHFAFPQAYERIVPRLLGDPAFWVRWSGIAEIACAALLAGPRTRRVSALATMGVLVVIFPANVKMALDGGIAEQPFPLGSPLVAWGRLPLQVPILVWAWKVAAAARDRRPTALEAPSAPCHPGCPPAPET